MATSFPLTDTTFSSRRHTTHYRQAGPAGRPLMIFLHGWPEIGLVWRAQMEVFASEGWHCIAPDMRGYPHPRCPRYRICVRRYNLLSGRGYAGADIESGRCIL
jgi:pimeloyl-ACP methyl ester carboxylesterase